MMLKGRPICRGVVEGRAHVARALSEARSVLPGDILVCRESFSEFTPLFGLVGAVVAESGGLLDHAAVLVREFGVPAVFGVAEATDMLHTGDRVWVDANHGLIARRLPQTDRNTLTDNE
jgi:pyruvate,water dikinase